jgi:cytidylate kinase
MVTQQREIAATDDIVVEGRDIGTVVFPDAEVKVYLTASAGERARRRTAQQAASGHIVDPTGVFDALSRRDALDSNRTVSPLEPAVDAHELDTTGLSVDEVVDSIVNLAEEARR